jgi:hypothetical protein
MNTLTHGPLTITTKTTPSCSLAGRLIELNVRRGTVFIVFTVLVISPLDMRPKDGGPLVLSSAYASASSIGQLGASDKDHVGAAKCKTHCWPMAILSSQSQWAI